ncbi:hypothetical protein BDB01DRAFT_834535 [Pilobolus umbonatus]|nr:hypothetical protein BDB01DRAFT_834535 [Pilobolus umbonatus]
MTYHILDHASWDTLRNSKWYFLDSIHSVFLHLMTLDYSNPKERREAHKKLKDFLTRGYAGTSMVSTTSRIPERPTYVTDSDPVLRQIIDSLDRILAYKEPQNEEEKQTSEEYCSNAKQLTDIIEKHCKLDTLHKWNRAIFEMCLLAVWSEKAWVDNNMQQVLSEIQLEQMSVWITKLNKDIDKKNAIIGNLQSQVATLQHNKNNKIKEEDQDSDAIAEDDEEWVLSKKEHAE